MKSSFQILLIVCFVMIYSSVYSQENNSNFYEPDNITEFRISPVMDPVLFEYLSAKDGFKILVRKEKSNELLQTMDFPYPEFKNYKFHKNDLILEDYNFDGFLDIKLMKDAPEISHFILLYDFNTKSFVYNKELSQLINTSIQWETKEIVSFKSIGFRSYIQRHYKFIDGKLILLKSITKVKAKETELLVFKITIKELRNNKMIITGEEIVDESNCDSKER